MVDIRKLKDDDKPQVRTLELFCIREYLEGSLRRAGMTCRPSSWSSWRLHQGLL